MVTFSYFHRVRYRECDPMGVVYHSHYIDYFEAARTEALREFGITYREIETSGIFMPVIEVTVKYRKPAYYDDLLEIRVAIPELPKFRIRIDYEVCRRGEEGEDLVATGRVDLCFLDRVRNRLTRAPETMIRALRAAERTEQI